MSSTIDAIRRLVAQDPARPAVRWTAGALTYADLLRRATAIARALKARDIKVAALLADNG